MLRVEGALGLVAIAPHPGACTGCWGCAGKDTGPNLARIVKTIRSTRLSGNHMSPSQHHKWEVQQ